MRSAFFKENMWDCLAGATLQQLYQIFIAFRGWFHTAVSFDRTNGSSMSLVRCLFFRQIMK